jgi:hypothetical protein
MDFIFFNSPEVVGFLNSPIGGQKIVEFGEWIRALKS